MNQKRVIVIAGGSGELAKYLIEDLINPEVCICSLDKEDIHTDYPINHYICDITDKEWVDKTFSDISQKYGRIDVLINMVGFHINRSFLEVSPDELDKAFRINVMGVFFLMQSVVPYMRKNNGGKIINISSSAAFDHVINTSVYAMTKSAVNCLTQCMAKELNDFNIAVYALCPTVIHTDKVEKNIEKLIVSMGKTRHEVISDYCNDLNAEKRMLQPYEVTRCIKMLLYDKHNSMTGTLFPLNCGSTMRP